MEIVLAGKSKDTSDLEAVLEIVRSYSPDADEWHQARLSLEREFEELGDNRFIYLAWEGIHPIGVVQVILKNADNDKDLADGTNVAHLHHLRVLHNRRRQGLGQQLMRHAENEARSLGFRRLTLGVDSWNADAIAFYNRLGYELFKEAEGQTSDTRLYYLKKDLVEATIGGQPRPEVSMTNRSRESEYEAVKRTLEASYCPPLIRQARERQDQLLTERLRPGPFKIADIGCGNGYHAVLLAPVTLLYHGFEISPAIAETARALWQTERPVNAQIFVGDVAEAALEDAFYDIVLCLYFTPGNFRDLSDDLGLYSDAYLDRNPAFIRIMSHFYRSMRIGGSMFLTIYKDVPEAEAAQIDFYEHTGQHVVTPRGSRFVATAEGFWSARWTRASLLSNLNACGIGSNAVVFNDLNSIAWLVDIKK